MAHQRLTPWLERRLKLENDFFYGSLSLSAMDFGETYQHFDYIEYTSGIFNMALSVHNMTALLHEQ